MATTTFIPSVLGTLSRDGWLLFATRFARLFAYGSLSVILVFYLAGLGLTEAQVGLVLTLALVGDVVVSLYLTTRADRIGRRRMLIIGSILMAAADLAFACTSNLLFLVIAGTIGLINPSGNEVGPFLSIEQVALAHIVPAAARTEVFAWQGVRQPSARRGTAVKTDAPYYSLPRLAPGLHRHDLSLVHLCIQMIRMGKRGRRSRVFGGTWSCSARRLSPREKV